MKREEKATVPARYAKASICECGYAVLKEPLGTVYDVSTELAGTAIYKCGGCGKEKLVEVIWCADVGFLPAEIFEMMRN